jgi:hypothetical protein
MTSSGQPRHRFYANILDLFICYFDRVLIRITSRLQVMQAHDLRATDSRAMEAERITPSQQKRYFLFDNAWLMKTSR